MASSPLEAILTRVQHSGTIPRQLNPSSTNIQSRQEAGSGADASGGESVSMSVGKAGAIVSDVGGSVVGLELTLAASSTELPGCATCPAPLVLDGSHPSSANDAARLTRHLR